MVSRLYVTFGCLVLLGYAVVSYEGWELVRPRQALPAAGLAAGSGGGGGGGSSWWFFSSNRSGMGGGRGGK
jgi:hypothetical protein